MGNENFTAAPSGTFRTADGYLNIAANRQEQYATLCRLTGREDLIEDARFAHPADRKTRREELRTELEAALAARPAAEWEEILSAAGVPAARVLSVPEVLELEQLTARDFVHDLPFPDGRDRPLRVLGGPLRVDGEPPAPPARPPLLGEHTDAVLAELGYGAAEIAALRERGRYERGEDRGRGGERDRERERTYGHGPGYGRRTRGHHRARHGDRLLVHGGQPDQARRDPAARLPGRTAHRAGHLRRTDLAAAARRPAHPRPGPAAGGRPGRGRGPRAAGPVHRRRPDGGHLRRRPQQRGRHRHRTARRCARRGRPAMHGGAGADHRRRGRARDRRGVPGAARVPARVRAPLPLARPAPRSAPGAGGGGGGQRRGPRAGTGRRARAGGGAGGGPHPAGPDEHRRGHRHHLRGTRLPARAGPWPVRPLPQRRHPGARLGGNGDRHPHQGPPPPPPPGRLPRPGPRDVER